MQTSTNKPFFDRQFWKIGLVMLCVALTAGAAKIYSAVSRNTETQASADLKMRAAYPELKWAFDEWDKCNHGGDDYAKNGYFTREQCDLAILALAKKRGDEQQVASALRVRDSK